MIAFRGWLAFPRWDPVWTPGQSWKAFGKRVSAKRCGLLGHNNLIGARSGFFACCFLGFAGTLWAKQRTWFSSSAGCGQSGEVHRAEGLLVLLSRRRFVCLPVCYFWINGFFLLLSWQTGCVFILFKSIKNIAKIFQLYHCIAKIELILIFYFTGYFCLFCSNLSGKIWLT